MTNDTPSTPNIPQPVATTEEEITPSQLEEIENILDNSPPMFIHAIGLGFGTMDLSTGDSEPVGFITLSGQVANPMADLDITGLEGFDDDLEFPEHLTVDIPGVMTLDALRGLRAKMDRVIAEADAYVARMTGEGPGEGQ